MYEIDQALASGNCIGCGACAFAYPDDYTIDLSSAEHFEARALEQNRTNDASPICPMTGSSRNEDEIAERLYPGLPRDDQIGKYLSTFASNVNEGSYRDLGGSGGLVSWLAAELLRRNLVDAVLHVKPVVGGETDPLLFRYAISRSAEEVREGAEAWPASS